MKDRLSRRQELAAGYVARGWSQQKIAQELDISPRTVQRWLQNPLFKARVEEEARALEAPDEAGATKELFPDAINAIKELLWSESAIARLGAARLIMQSLGISNRVSLEETEKEMIWERASYLLVKMFNRNEELKKKALEELHKIRNNVQVDKLNEYNLQ